MRTVSMLGTEAKLYNHHALIIASIHPPGTEDINESQIYRKILGPNASRILDSILQPLALAVNTGIMQPKVAGSLEENVAQLIMVACEVSMHG